MLGGWSVREVLMGEQLGWKGGGQGGDSRAMEKKEHETPQSGSSFENRPWVTSLKMERQALPARSALPRWSVRNRSISTLVQF